MARAAIRRMALRLFRVSGRWINDAPGNSKPHVATFNMTPVAAAVRLALQQSLQEAQFKRLLKRFSKKFSWNNLLARP